MTGSGGSQAGLPGDGAPVLRRRAVVQFLLDGHRSGLPSPVAEAGPQRLLVVSGLGAPSWDVASVGDFDTHFPLWGAMGGAAMCGLGLALACPDRRVLVITGDGEMLMGLGALASIAAASPGNLALVVLDNRQYGETGMQQSHTARGVDLAGMARAAGFRAGLAVTEKAGLAEARDVLLQAEGPVAAVFAIGTQPDPLVLPPRCGVWLKQRFRMALWGKRCMLD